MIPDDTSGAARKPFRSQPGVGHNPQTLFLCGHFGQRLGAKMRGRLPLRCAACVRVKAGA